MYIHNVCSISDTIVFTYLDIQDPDKISVQKKKSLDFFFRNLQGETKEC